MPAKKQQPSMQEQRQDRRKVLEALQNPKYTWRTVHGIALETGLTQKRVKAVLARRGRLIIKSEISDEYGNDLFARMDHYAVEAHQPTSAKWRRLVAAAAREGLKVGVSEGGRLITGGLPIGEIVIAIWEEWNRFDQDE